MDHEVDPGVDQGQVQGGPGADQGWIRGDAGVYPALCGAGRHPWVHHWPGEGSRPPIWIVAPCTAASVDVCIQERNTRRSHVKLTSSPLCPGLDA